MSSNHFLYLSLDDLHHAITNSVLTTVLLRQSLRDILEVSVGRCLERTRGVLWVVTKKSPAPPTSRWRLTNIPLLQPPDGTDCWLPSLLTSFILKSWPEPGGVKSGAILRLEIQRLLNSCKCSGMLECKSLSLERASFFS